MPEFNVGDTVVYNGQNHRVLYFDTEDPSYCLGLLNNKFELTATTVWCDEPTYRIKPFQETAFINIIPLVDSYACSKTHKTVAEADEHASPNRIARVKIQFTKGQLDT